MDAARENNVEILPVDSEHNAIFQALKGYREAEIRRLILTASGGPLAEIEGDLSDIPLSVALKHPVWKMGKKLVLTAAQ